ncbi:MAG: PQQ-dependent sugar dehydrogenase [Desulfobacterales bacterium]|jgi:glucose/arabinose dehydrogenase
MKPRFSFVMLFLFFVMCSDRLAAQPYITQSDVPAERGFRAVALLRGLEHPWGMAWLPNGDILITERPGRLRRVQDGRLASDPIAGVPDVFDSGQGGLLDISLHPRFEEDRRLYFTYAHGNTFANRTRVATAVLNGNRLANWQVIFEVAANKVGSQHFGSRLLWLPDETLFVSIGDGGNPPVRLAGDWIRKQAQNRQSHLGKILRIKDDGAVPPDNPFADAADAQASIWSYGHRNIQGLAYDPLRSMVWASEHGALGGDELNLIRAGRNYGWPTVTFSREYFDGSKISAHTSKPGMVDPVVVWMTAIAPSGLVVYTGTQFEQWRGDLFVGGLKSQDIRRVDLNEAGQVVGQSALRIGQRVRDVRQGPDGLLYVLTDESNGSLIRLEPVSDKESPSSP